MTSRILVLALLVPAHASAEHEHGMGDAPGRHASFGVALSLVMATYDQMLYAGDYQGVSPSLRWADERFAVAASLPFYRLRENGRLLYGPGDGVVHGVVRLARGHRVQAGAALAVSVPTGAERTGFGMGHVMVMPGLWASHLRGPVQVGVSLGYGRALGDASDHVHGPWPIVDPMNLSELTWSANADLTLARGLRIGARTNGAVPVGEDGEARVTGGVRVVWTEGRVETAATAQVGIAGDPFVVRGVVETAVRF